MERERIFDVIGIDKETDKVVVNKCGVIAPTKEEALSKALKNTKLDKNKIKFTIIYHHTLDNFKEDIEEALKKNNETWDDVIQINTDEKVITNMEEAKKLFDYNYERYDCGGQGVLIWTKNHVYSDSDPYDISIVDELKKATTLEERLTIIAHFIDVVREECACEW